MPEAVDFYHAIMGYNGDYWHAVTRALTLKWAMGLPWHPPVLELGGQDGDVIKLSGRFVDLMVDTAPDAGPGRVYGNVLMGDAQALDLPYSGFRTVLALNMVYHCDRDKVLSECHRVLGTSGLLIVTDSPGYDDVLTWPLLLRQGGRVEEAMEWQKKELDLHQVNLVPWEWWDNANLESRGWQVVRRQEYCSLNLGMATRAHHTLGRLMSSLGFPQGAYVQQARDLVSRFDSIQHYVEQDEAMCQEEGGVFLFLALRRVP